MSNNDAGSSSSPFVTQLRKGMEAGATDVRVCPRGDRISVAYRIDGTYREQPALKPADYVAFALEAVPYLIASQPVRDGEELLVCPLGGPLLARGKMAAVADGDMFSIRLMLSEPQTGVSDADPIRKPDGALIPISDLLRQYDAVVEAAAAAQVSINFSNVETRRRLEEAAVGGFIAFPTLLRIIETGDLAHLLGMDLARRPADRKSDRLKH